MKLTFASLFIILFFLFACTNSGTQPPLAQQKTDSLQQLPTNYYKPGLGEFMTGIQLHHAKLWFAGKNENWPLAAFEIKEIEEAIGDIQQFCTDRPEVKFIGMMDAPTDSLKKAIDRKNSVQFTNGYDLLTTVCNDCHKQTNHAFNVIITPAAPPVSNQEFRPMQKK